ncbi:Serpin domain-containing protein [Neocallimastix sp. 'constans']|jgi:serpin B
MSKEDISAVKTFQIPFFQEVNKNNNGKNVLLSPVSVYHLMSLAANGAAKTTQSEMLKALQSKDVEELNNTNKDVAYRLKLGSVDIANAAFTVFEPEKAFTDAIKKYKAKVELLKDADQINKWVSDNTHEKITKIIDNLNKDDLMVLINAIYFKGNWKKEFQANATKKRKFKNFNKEEKETDFMTMVDKIDYAETDDVQAISLDYKKDNLKALVILPKKEEINAYIKGLTEEKYNTIIKKLENQKVDLSLPKFSVDFESDLKPELQALGMVEAFTDKADFSVIKKENDLSLKRCITKTFLNVDEKGTEAGAASAALVSREVEVGIPVMNIDHPFLFIIRSTKMTAGYDMLFAAKVEQI